MDFLFQPSVELLPNAKAAAVFVPDSSTVFREDSRLDVRTLPNGMRFVLWGVDMRATRIRATIKMGCRH